MSIILQGYHYRELGDADVNGIVTLKYEDGLVKITDSAFPLLVDTEDAPIPLNDIVYSMFKSKLIETNSVDSAFLKGTHDYRTFAEVVNYIEVAKELPESFVKSDVLGIYSLDTFGAYGKLKKENQLNEKYLDEASYITREDTSVGLYSFSKELTIEELQDLGEFVSCNSVPDELEEKVIKTLTNIKNANGNEEINNKLLDLANLILPLADSGVLITNWFHELRAPK